VWFLEMNTRLQVEHPVTELVTGLDLVALQLAVAEGARVPEVPATSGHAVEVRLYAEDPADDYRPQSGLLTRFDVSHEVELGGLDRPGVRLDAGYRSGDEVGTHYDAMLAKVVAWGPTRRQTLRRLAATLQRAQVHGVRTNRDLLVEVLRHPRMVEGHITTEFLATHDLAALSPKPPDLELLRSSAFAAAVALAVRAGAERSVQSGVPAGWRNVVSQPQGAVFECDGQEVVAQWYRTRTGYRSPGGTLTAELSGADVVVATSATSARRRFTVHVDDHRVDVESSLGHVALTRRPRFVDPADQVASGSLLAPMPGTVTRVDVVPGDAVAAGQSVLVLEAMKMQHTVTAPHGGEVTGVAVGVGSHVAAGAVLAVVRSPTHEGETP
jgi:propionyl-CoA carboxylase alpha chain